MATGIPIQIFVSYARKDFPRWFEKYPLIPSLASSLRKYRVDVWWDKEGILPADDFNKRIRKEIEDSQIALLMVTQPFLDSEFIEDVELKCIEERANRDELLVIPILLEPCPWQEFEFLASRQMLPGPKPLIGYVKDEAEWVDVQAEILPASAALWTGSEQSIFRP